MDELEEGGAELEAPDEDFGGAELEELEELPPPPPAPRQGGEITPPPPELLAISARMAASSDNLEMQSLIHAALCASVADVLADTTITAAERRRELRTISAAAAKSFPYRRLFEAEQAVKSARAELETRKRAKAGALLELRPSSSGGKIAAIRGTAVKTDGIEPK